MSEREVNVRVFRQVNLRSIENGLGGIRAAVLIRSACPSVFGGLNPYRVSACWYIDVGDSASAFALREVSAVDVMLRRRCRAVVVVGRLYSLADVEGIIDAVAPNIFHQIGEIYERVAVALYLRNRIVAFYLYLVGLVGLSPFYI